MTLYFRGVLPIARNEEEQVSYQFRKLEWRFLLLIGILFENLLTAPQKNSAIYNALCTSTSNLFHDRLDEIRRSQTPSLSIIQAVLYWILYLPIAVVISSLYAIIETSGISPGATHIPTFYATNVSWSDADTKVVYFVLPTVAAVFGGLHCLGWNFPFRTLAKQIIWRVTLISITVIPLVTGFVLSLNRKRLLDMKAQRVVAKQGVVAKCMVYFACSLLFL